MRILYSLLLYMLTPLILLRLWWKGRRLPAYRQRWRERFALQDWQGDAPDVWLHAVSLGEVIAVSPLIEALLARKQRLLVTTMTPTGSAQVLKSFGGRLAHQYIPYDLPWVVKRFYRQVKPKLGLIMETELWPNLLILGAKAGVPLAIINARLSPQSFRGYYRFRYWLQPVLDSLSWIACQSPADAERFAALGVEPTRLQVFGNLKFDLQLKALTDPVFDQLPQQWGKDRLVLMAASTHEDEETQILQAWPRLLADFPNALLMIAPRHPERFKIVEGLARQCGYQVDIRSQASKVSNQTQVLILDCLGELQGWYGTAQYAFVGGSLVEKGGHNMLEAIARNTLVLTGPSLHNFQFIADALLAKQAMLRLESAQAIMEAILDLQQHPSRREQQLVAAQAVLTANQGALGRYLNQIGLS